MNAILCDIEGCRVLIPNYWWRGLWEMVGKIAFVCLPHQTEMIDEPGLSVDDFVPGDLVSAGHWRPAEVRA